MTITNKRKNPIRVSKDELAKLKTKAQTMVDAWAARLTKEDMERYPFMPLSWRYIKGLYLIRVDANHAMWHEAV